MVVSGENSELQLCCTGRGWDHLLGMSGGQVSEELLQQSPQLRGPHGSHLFFLSLCLFPETLGISPPWKWSGGSSNEPVAVELWNFHHMALIKSFHLQVPLSSCRTHNHYFLQKQDFLLDKRPFNNLMNFLPPFLLSSLNKYLLTIYHKTNVTRFSVIKI